LRQSVKWRCSLRSATSPRSIGPRSLPHVSQSARLSGAVTEASGASATPSATPRTRSRALLGGVRSVPDACRYRPAEPRFVPAIAECAACVGRGVHVIRVDCERVCQVLPDNCVHLYERALALNLDPRRQPRRHLLPVFPPARLVRHVRSRAEHRSGQRVAITTRDCPAVLRAVKPLRFAPSLAGCGLDRASAAPEIGQLRDGHSSNANVLSA
jgi:hypothetical protein